MRFVSTMALGLMLSIGGAAVVGVSPAIAAKKEKAPGQDFSNAFREVAANLQKSVQSKDFEAAKTQLAAAESAARSEEHTSELQSLMRISYAVFCLKKKKQEMTSKNNTNKSI